METTVIISLITALAAIIAPVITAIINNKTTLKLKKIEEKESKLKDISLHEREVLEKALSGIGILMSYKDAESIKESCRSLLTAIAYVDTKTGNQLRSVVSSVMDRNKDISIEEYSEICESIKRAITERTNL